jgi:N-acetylglutamate synthase-like GNAT family acetyltransferase
MLRDNNLAGVIIGTIDNQEMNVKLDYVTPRYRDFKLGKYYFIENIELLKQKGIQAVKASAKEKDHQAYLEKLGFEKVANSTDQYKKTL